MCPAKSIGLIVAVTLAACTAPSNDTPASTPTTSSSESGTGKAIGVACPEQTFEGFLKQYAADEQVREAFTMPILSVVDFRNPDEPVEGTRVINVPRTEYEGFHLRHRDDGFHVVDSAGEVDPIPVDINVEQSGTDDFLVSYQYGMSEGGSYLFKKHKDCWVLFGEPNPPSP